MVARRSCTVTGSTTARSPVYSREELVAKMGAAFLCGQAGIDAPALQVNQAAYIGGWLHQLRGDSRLVVQAAAQAQKAADWMLGTQPASESDSDDAGSVHDPAPELLAAVTA